jgi:hypothetical protein
MNTPVLELPVPGISVALVAALPVMVTWYEYVPFVDSAGPPTTVIVYWVTPPMPTTAGPSIEAKSVESLWACTGITNVDAMSTHIIIVNDISAFFV